MFAVAGALGLRSRVLLTRLLRRLGLDEDVYLVVLAVFIGGLAAVAACGFHEFINFVRDHLFRFQDPAFLYGSGMGLLILWPLLGGLAVGLISHARGAGGQGVPDVIESVVRRQGFMPASTTIEKIVTAGITIGSGGSAGAEGPIVQIGAGIASLTGKLFQTARHHMPILIGCGCAAGISAIFNAPIGGVLFTLEVILRDFSIKTFTPLVLASVVANVATQSLFRDVLHSDYNAIFAMPMFQSGGPMSFGEFPAFIGLGLTCGVAAVMLVRSLFFVEERAARLPGPRFLKPALGGAVVGMLGVAYVVVLGWGVIGEIKPISFDAYPMPAFFGDGYGVVRRLLDPLFYSSRPSGVLWALLGTLLLLKIIATSVTLGSGGSGGVIAPSLFIGAAMGGLVGFSLSQFAAFSAVKPSLYALAGMGAVLGAVVHAPMAAILIVVELTGDYRVILPAMLCVISAVGMARLLYPQSVYSRALLQRGIRLGGGESLNSLRQMSIEQVGLEPVTSVRPRTSVAELLQCLGERVRDVVVVSDNGDYAGLISREAIEQALLNPGSIPLLLAEELMDARVPLLRCDQDLAAAAEAFAAISHDTLPVCLPGSPTHVAGMMSRQRLMQAMARLEPNASRQT
jgi:CIC family chloride channel protein